MILWTISFLFYIFQGRVEETKPFFEDRQNNFMFCTTCTLRIRVQVIIKTMEMIYFYVKCVTPIVSVREKHLPRNRCKS